MRELLIFWQPSGAKILMQLEILKCHGSGNDFVLLDETGEKFKIPEADRSDLAQTLCDRSGSVGADGVLFYQESNIADIKVRMFNPDGSESEFCGNGTRCVARLAMENNAVDTVRIETIRNVIQARKIADISPGVYTVAIELEKASFEPREVPIALESECVNQKVPMYSDSLNFTALSLPNPHFITVVEEVTEDEIVRIGSLVNSKESLLTQGANVSFCWLVGENSIYVRTYERGAGLTLSCGSGMTATSVVTARLGLVEYDEWIKVYNNGGMVLCKTSKREDVFVPFLAGNATFVFKASVDCVPGKSLSNQFSGVMYEDDIHAYGKLLEGTIKDLGEFKREGKLKGIPVPQK